MKEQIKYLKIDVFGKTFKVEELKKKNNVYEMADVFLNKEENDILYVERDRSAKRTMLNINSFAMPAQQSQKLAENKKGYNFMNDPKFQRVNNPNLRSGS